MLRQPQTGHWQQFETLPFAIVQLAMLQATTEVHCLAHFPFLQTTQYVRNL